MKREILFKGKRVDNGEWIEGFLMQDNFIRRKISCLRNGRKRTAYSQHEVHPDTVCQFTGLLDKNGIRIYEGDIDKSDSVIKWWNERALFGLFYDFSEERPDSYPLFANEIEIIGNTHD